MRANARYRHAKLVKEWLERPGCRIKLHFLPAYRPRLNPIERLWGIMHKNKHHAQQDLRHLQGIRRGDPRLSARQGTPGTGANIEAQEQTIFV